MLKILGKKQIAKKILIVLAVIIVPAFVLWGSGSLIRGRKGINYAGIIFGKKIIFDQYNSSLLACKNQAIIHYGDNFYKIQRFLDFNTEAWDRLILLYEAKRRKIKVSNSEVIQKIANIPFFKSGNRFDKKIYQYLLDNVFRTSARKFEEEIRQLLMLEKLFEQITESVSVDEDKLFPNYKKENEKVRVDFIHFPVELFIDQIILDDKEIDDYFQKHKEEFRKPPSVNIQYLGLDYPKDAKETDKSALVKKMLKIASKVKKVANLEKISEAENLPIKETGYFTLEGPVPEIGWSYQFIQTAFNLKPNQVSKLLKIQKGCYILKLKEKKDSYIPDIKEIKEPIVNILKQKNAKELAQAKAEEYLKNILEIYQANPKNVDFEKLAKKWDIKAGKTALFNRGDYIPNIGISKIFSEVAFGLKDKQEPFGVVSAEMGTFIIKLEEYIPTDENKFLEERESFKTKLLQTKKNEYFNKFFEDLKKKANLVDNINPSKSLLP